MVVYVGMRRVFHLIQVIMGASVEAKKNRLYLNEEWLRQQLTIHKNAAQIAKHHGYPQRTVSRAIKNLKETGSTAKLRMEASLIHQMEDTCPIEFRPDPVVVSGRGVVSSDWHLPLTDYKKAALLVDLAVKHDTTDYLLIVGDYFNLDALSQYNPKQDDAGFSVEIDRGRELINILLEVFDKIIITRGNHDERLAATTGWRMQFVESMQLLIPEILKYKNNLIISELDYAHINTEHGTWIAAHTKQYSKVPLSIPRELCDIHQMNVAAAHRHHHAIGKSKGGFYAVELGGLFDASKTKYLSRWTTTHPKWTPGWMVLHEGGPYLPMLAPAPS